MKFLNSIGYWLSFLLPGIGHFGNEYHAALDVLWPRFGSLCISGEPRLAAAEHELDELAQKIKSLKPLQRRAYAIWIAYYRYEIKRPPQSGAPESRTHGIHQKREVP